MLRSQIQIELDEQLQQLTAANTGSLTVEQVSTYLDAVVNADIAPLNMAKIAFKLATDSNIVLMRFYSAERHEAMLFHCLHALHTIWNKDTLSEQRRLTANYWYNALTGTICITSPTFKSFLITSVDNNYHSNFIMQGLAGNSLQNRQLIFSLLIKLLTDSSDLFMAMLEQNTDNYYGYHLTFMHLLVLCGDAQITKQFISILDQLAVTKPFDVLRILEALARFGRGVGHVIVGLYEPDVVLPFVELLARYNACDVMPLLTKKVEEIGRVPSRFINATDYFDLYYPYVQASDKRLNGTWSMAQKILSLSRSSLSSKAQTLLQAVEQEITAKSPQETPQHTWSGFVGAIWSRRQPPPVSIPATAAAADHNVNAATSFTPHQAL